MIYEWTETNKKIWEWLTTDSCVWRGNISSSRQVIIFRARLHQHWSRAMVGGQTAKWRMMIAADEMRFAQKQFVARANGWYQNVGQPRVVFIRVSLNFSTKALFEVQSGRMSNSCGTSSLCSLSVDIVLINESFNDISSNIWNVPSGNRQPNSQISQQFRFDDVVARSVSAFLTLSIELQLFRAALSVQFSLFALIVRRLQLPGARKLLTPQSAESRWNCFQQIPSTHQQYTT